MPPKSASKSPSKPSRLSNKPRFVHISTISISLTPMHSDCHGSAKPAGSRVGSARVRVRVGYFRPAPYPDPHHGLAVTRENTRENTCHRRYKKKPLILPIYSYFQFFFSNICHSLSMSHVDVAISLYINNHYKLDNNSYNSTDNSKLFRSIFTTSDPMQNSL